MDAALIEQALKRLGQLALADDLTLDVCIYGGTAFMLAYNSRTATRDIDAILSPRERGMELAQKVAGELHLDEDWINDDVKQFLASKEQLRALPGDWPGLRIYVPTAGYLLALKALAARRPLPGYAGDADDLRFLIRKMGIQSIDDIQTHIDRYFPNDTPTSEQAAWLEVLIKEAQDD